MNQIQLSAVTDILSTALSFTSPADAVVSRHFRDNRKLGSNDRRIVAETVFSILRHLPQIEWLIGTLPSPRQILLAWFIGIERRNLLKALGAEIVLTDGLAGMAGSSAKAQELRDKIPGAVILQQFENPSNARIHELTTGEEIWTDTDGQVDVFVAGVGTGGTICGVARALKRHNPNVYIVAVEPASSPVLEGGEDAPHRIQGIGANFIPALYDASVVDEVIPVPDDEAIRAGRELASTEGLLAGISSGAAVYAARLLAVRPEFADKTVVALLPDTGERYLSTELFAFDTYPLD